MSDAPAVRWEDAELLVVEKPAGMLVHPVAAGERGALTEWLAAHLARSDPAATVHLVGRLDRDTSGLVLVAKRAAAHARLERLRARGGVGRGYRAIVEGCPEPPEGVVDAPIGRSAEDPPLRAVRPDGAPARTRYRVEERLRGAALVALELETGRTHQIRVHLLHRGHPVLGDRWYGRRGLDRMGRQALHAARLAVARPGLEPLVVESPLPADMAALRRQLLVRAL